jgi:hypothetical protein
MTYIVKQSLFLFLCLIFFIITLPAQVPQGIPYQAVARSAAGDIVSNQSIRLRFSIRDLFSNGSIVYQETKSTSTNEFGLFNVVIGQGVVVTGTFSSINWSTTKYLQTELDITGGTSFTNMGVQQFFSVPYALKSGDIPKGTNNGQTLRWDGSDWINNSLINNDGINVGIGTNTLITKFSVNGLGNVPTLPTNPSSAIMRIYSSNTNLEFGQFAGSPYSSWIQAGISSTGDPLSLQPVAGFVGIGTADPNSLLHLKSTAGSGGHENSGLLIETSGAGEPTIKFKNSFIPSSRIWFYGLNESPSLAFGYGQSFSNSATLMVFDTLGNLGIGANPPAFQLHLGSNSAAKPTSTLWTVSSDARLKENVKPFNDGLSKILEINPVWYTYNGQAGLPKETGVGAIAQEIQKIAPYMIKPWIYKADDKDKNGTEYLGIDYNALIFMFINAFKEQQKMIEELKKENELNKNAHASKELVELKNKTDRLENELEILKTMVSQISIQH